MEDNKKNENKLSSTEDAATTQCNTISTHDEKSEMSLNISSEEPQWSSVDSMQDDSLNLHSGLSLCLSEESQKASNTLNENFSFGESDLSVPREHSLQVKTGPNSISENMKGHDLHHSESEGVSTLDSSRSRNLSLAEENLVVHSSSLLEKTSICQNDFEKDVSVGKPESGLADELEESASNNGATKKKFYEISPLNQEVSEPTLTDPLLTEEISSSSTFFSEKTFICDSTLKKDSSNYSAESGLTDILKESDNGATKKRSFHDISPESWRHIKKDQPCKKFKPELQVSEGNSSDSIGDSNHVLNSDTEKNSSSKQKILTSDSSQSLSDPIFVKTDCLEDTQQKITSEKVPTDMSDPSENQQAEMVEIEEEYRSYNFSQAPKFLTHCSEEFTKNNFLKGCKWAPDGSCILTNSEDRCLRLFNIPEQIYNSEINTIPPIESVLKMQESGTIYDYCWYPGMSSAMPETCCLVSTSKDTPVHMWDAFTSELRCTYRAYDQMDEIAAAHSLAFSLDGQKLYCGFRKMIRVFDIERPGRQFTERPTYIKKTGGQAGIISCIIPSPVDHSLYATGSYSKEIALYWEPSGQMMCMFEGHQGGVTHIVFSPDGNRIYSGGRKDPEILCWDLRNPGNILFTLLRQAETNQRMYFDLDRSGRYVISGNHDGTITVWDTTSTPVTFNSESDPLLYPCSTYPAHNDTTNGISIHPFLPIVASTSGQRHFSVFDDSESEDDVLQKPTSTNDLRFWYFS